MFNKEELSNDRFPSELSHVIDLKETVKILNETMSLKKNFPHLKIATRDTFKEVIISDIYRGSGHSIQLKYENSSWTVVDHQLPIPNAFEGIASCTNLIDSIRRYIIFLDDLFPFYKSLDAIDQVSIIGEPKVITMKTNWRLIKYSNNVFIRIEFTNPLNIEEVKVTFHGQSDVVNEMTETYNSRCDDFQDSNTFIYDKLLNIFDIPFFPATEQDEINCSICLSYRCEENRVPVVCCDNMKCDSMYHISCLEKYLKIQKHVKVLSIYIGECPFCKETLSNSYAQFFHKSSDDN